MITLPKRPADVMDLREMPPPEPGEIKIARGWDSEVGAVVDIKYCNGKYGCTRWHNVTAFSRHKSSPDGLQTYCKIGVKRASDARAEKKEKIKLEKQAVNLANLEKARAARAEKRALESHNVALEQVIQAARLGHAQGMAVEVTFGNMKLRLLPNGGQTTETTTK